MFRAVTMITGMWRVFSCRLELVQGGEAVHARHEHVQQDQVRLFLVRDVQGLLAVDGLQEPVRFAAQRVAKHAAVVVVVVHNQRLLAGSCQYLPSFQLVQKGAEPVGQIQGAHGFGDVLAAAGRPRRSSSPFMA